MTPLQNVTNKDSHLRVNQQKKCLTNEIVMDYSQFCRHPLGHKNFYVQDNC